MTHALAEVLQLRLGQQRSAVVEQVLLLVVGEQPVLDVVHIRNLLRLPHHLGRVRGAVLDVVDVNVGQALQRSVALLFVFVH